MEKRFSKFYDLRFIILIAIIISILLFKYFTAQTVRSVPPPPRSSVSTDGPSGDTLIRAPAGGHNAAAP